ncbi:hypothetical protein EDB81DRAFT_771139 [Dactylonectria macrodidyma]|uniref:Secreted protein n=1 Tax=Dactylonectria macrodidyma TaxID=307937 RepID=A0A9P9FTP7_9HYPO|nr:hypothetical protein EDB81DRAFT_771139 [Dactylonectria macrodidyma]
MISLVALPLSLRAAVSQSQLSNAIRWQSTASMRVSIQVSTTQDIIDILGCEPTFCRLLQCLLTYQASRFHHSHLPQIIWRDNHIVCNNKLTHARKEPSLGWGTDIANPGSLTSSWG